MPKLFIYIFEFLFPESVDSNLYISAHNYVMSFLPIFPTRWMEFHYLWSSRLKTPCVMHARSLRWNLHAIDCFLFIVFLTCEFKFFVAWNFTYTCVTHVHMTVFQLTTLCLCLNHFRCALRIFMIIIVVFWTCYQIAHEYSLIFHALLIFSRFILICFH